MSTREPRSAAPISPDVIEIERALTRIAYVLSRVRHHDALMVEAGVTVDRGAFPIIRLLADGEPLRSGELAARLEVEAPHVTRQVQRLERAGYVTRVPDPDDRRAHLVGITGAGRDAVDRVRQVAWRGLQGALANWSPEDLRQLAVLFHRMVDDFLAVPVRPGDSRAALPSVT